MKTPNKENVEQEQRRKGQKVTKKMNKPYKTLYIKKEMEGEERLSLN